MVFPHPLWNGPKKYPLSILFVSRLFTGNHSIKGNWVYIWNEALYIIPVSSLLRLYVYLYPHEGYAVSYKQQGIHIWTLNSAIIIPC